MLRYVATAPGESPPGSWNLRRCGLAGVQGKPILAFVIGGVVRSEVRVAHQLTQRLGRQVTVGSTSIETPASFLSAMRDLSSPP